MVFTLMDSEATDEEKTSVRQYIEMEKIKHSQRIANANAYNEEQLKLFNQLVQLHQQEYKTLCSANIAEHAKQQAKLRQQNQDVEMQEDDKSEESKLKQMFQTFSLDSYGKTGLQLFYDDESTIQTKAQSDLIKATTYTHKVH